MLENVFGDPGKAAGQCGRFLEMRVVGLGLIGRGAAQGALGLNADGIRPRPGDGMAKGVGHLCRYKNEPAGRDADDRGARRSELESNTASRPVKSIDCPVTGRVGIWHRPGSRPFYPAKTL